jgi:integral membrane protein (TIGR01906 family)
MEGAQASSSWLTAARWLLQALIPLVLVLTSVRLLLTRGFIRLEYNLPGFPEDRYGFTQADRLAQAPIALDYLLNDAGIEFLGDLRFEDGSPVYNERELGHMVDVKNVVRGALRVWQAGALLAILLGLVLWRAGGPAALGAALVGGSKLTLGLMLVIFLGLVLAFSVVFVGFHQVFFDPGTWTFLFSDTLIRLFPQRFWEVAFAAVTLGSGALAGSLWALARRLLGG